MNRLCLVNLLSLVSFCIVAFVSLYKERATEVFIAASKADGCEVCALAFQACMLAWSALSACSIVAAGVSAINLWGIIPKRKANADEMSQ
jgi:hypothetical protein